MRTILRAAVLGAMGGSAGLAASASEPFGLMEGHAKGAAGIVALFRRP